MAGDTTELTAALGILADNGVKGAEGLLNLAGGGPHRGRHLGHGAVKLHPRIKGSLGKRADRALL